jgi:hypothetical protein
MKLNLSLKSLSLGLVTCILLGGAAFAFGTAWRIQAVAAERLELTKAIQDRTIPEVETDHPSPEVNRKILQNLAKAKGVRAAIDQTLREITASVETLRDRQGDSRRTIERSRARLLRLVRALGTATRPARSSAAGLDASVGTLHGSARLGAEILQELKELDEKLGGRVP